MSTPPGSQLASTNSAPAPASVPQPRKIQSEELLQGRVELLIAHGEETYRLRLTRNGKLILQK